MKVNRFFDEIQGNFGFGCMRLPMKDEKVDYDEFIRMADAFIDAGFNYFDTAHGYINGQSETAIRDCIAKRYDRSRFRMDSDTVAAFLAEETTPDPSARTERGVLFTAYKRYCFESDRQALTRNNFYRSMRVKGFRETASMGAWYFSGLKIGKLKKKDPIQTALEKGYVEVDEVLPF